MTICERCGKEMPDTAAICPSCGTASFIARPGTGMPIEYGQPPSAYPPPGYTAGYGPQSFPNPSQPVYVQQQGYTTYNVPPPMQPPISVNVNIAAPIAAPASAGNPGAIIAEVLLNVFVGVYGVGWLMAGETTTGIILLICSILLYWPVMVLGTIFTLGVGLLCLIPLAIAALILNPILLNNTIKRKTAYILVQPMQTFPPR
jgi:hypothetical protein